jgi:pyrimidine deaminase RibD-like protein/riboflavin biosynthesis pyrimidine reductase
MEGTVAERASSRLRRTTKTQKLEFGNGAMEAEDTFYLGIAAKLAKLGEAKAFPNPIVGAVIVCNDTVIGEGFHRKYGEAHAEPNAIKHLTDLFNNFIEKKKTQNSFHQEFFTNPSSPFPISYLAKAEELISIFSQFKSLEELIHESTIYVSLEPCNHYGKTAPCTELIHRLAFKRLVYACSDPNPLLTAPHKISDSIEIQDTKIERFYLDDLKESGMDVLCLEDFINNEDNKNTEIKDYGQPQENENSEKVCQIKDLLELIKFDNRIFFEFIDRKNKNKTDSKKISKNYWLTLKVASYADGSMETKINESEDCENGVGGQSHKTWITNSSSRKDVQRLRATHEVLITGINTIKNDNPMLNIRFSASELNLSDICDREIIILKSSQNFNDIERQSLKIFDSTYQQKVTEFTINPLSKEADSQEAILKLSKSQSENIFPNLSSLLNHLSSEKKLRIMVEAGPNLMKSFLKEGLVDEIIHYEALEVPAESSNDELIDAALPAIVSQSLTNILDRYKNLLEGTAQNLQSLRPHCSNEVLQKSLKCYLSKYEIIEAVNINERTDIKVCIRLD